MPTVAELANSLSVTLLAGTDFGIELPNFSGDDFKIPEETGPIFDPISRLTDADLSEGDNSVTGSGTFDVLMKSFRAHLKKEFDANRISGSEYTRAYIASTEAAMANATQFLLGREAAYWQSVNAQLEAKRAGVSLVIARVQLESEKARLQLLRLEALNAQVSYALNKIRLANESVSYDSAVYQLQNILPKNLDMLQKQILGQEATNVNLGKQGVLLDDEHSLSPQKLLLLTKQVASQEAQTNLTNKQVENMQKEIDLFPVKEDLLKEQVEVQRAQTLDTRKDGTVIVGSVGKQKALYTQQITSYQRDGEIKAVKLFTDAWTVMKTLDEGLDPPTAFSNANLNTILEKVKQNNILT